MTKIEGLRMKRWERIERGGIFRFVILKGSAWSICVAAIGYAFTTIPMAWYCFVPSVWFVGLIWGLVMWFVTMGCYAREKKRQRKMSK